MIACEVLATYPLDWLPTARIEWERREAPALKEIALAAMTKHANNWDAAREAAYAQVSADAELLCELFGAFRAMAVQKLLHDVNRELREDADRRARAARDTGRQHDTESPKPSTSSRSAEGRDQPSSGNHEAFIPPSRPAAPSTAGMAAAANVVRLSLLDTIDIEGTPVGQCTAGFARSWARKTGRHARWVMLLTSNLPPDDKISRWVTPQDAAELWRRTLEVEE